MDERQTTIRARLHDGALPSWTHKQLFAGYGRGDCCDACGKAITKRDIAYEVLRFPKDSAFLRMHMDCFNIWTALCAPQSLQQLSLVAANG